MMMMMMMMMDDDDYNDGECMTLAFHNV